MQHDGSGALPTGPKAFELEDHEAAFRSPGAPKKVRLEDAQGPVQVAAALRREIRVIEAGESLA